MQNVSFKLTPTASILQGQASSQACQNEGVCVRSLQTQDGSAKQNDGACMRSNSASTLSASPVFNSCACLRCLLVAFITFEMVNSFFVGGIMTGRRISDAG